MIGDAAKYSLPGNSDSSFKCVLPATKPYKDILTGNAVRGRVA